MKNSFITRTISKLYRNRNSPPDTSFSVFLKSIFSHPDHCRSDQSGLEVVRLLLIPRDEMKSSPLFGSSIGKWSAMSSTMMTSSLWSLVTLATSSALKSGLVLVHNTIWIIHRHMIASWIFLSISRLQADIVDIYDNGDWTS